MDYWPHGIHKTTKDGHPIYYETLAHTDYLGMLKATNREELIKYCAYICELSDKLLKELRERENKPIYKIVVLQNLQDVQTLPIGSEFLSLYKEIMKTITDNYPERMHKCYVINLPAARIFAIGWNLVKFVFDEKMRSKIEFLYGDWKPKLFEVIHEDDFPSYLGGKCPETKKAKGNKVPESMYKIYEKKTTVTIKAREKFVEEIRVDVPGTILQWDFATKGYDLKFGLYLLKDDTEDRIEILRPQRFEKCAIENVYGQFKTTKVGIYEFEWDNSYSLMRSKTLLYHVDFKLPNII